MLNHILRQKHVSHALQFQYVANMGFNLNYRSIFVIELLLLLLLP